MERQLKTEKTGILTKLLNRCDVAASEFNPTKMASDPHDSARVSQKGWNQASRLPKVNDRKCV